MASNFSPLYFEQPIVIYDTTESLNSSVGSFVLYGGVSINATYQSSSTSTGAFVLSGGAAVQKNLYVGGITNIRNSTQSEGTATGALVVEGGVGIGGNLHVGQDTFITGNLYVNGVTTSVNTTTINVSDNTLMLNSGPAGSRDAGVLIERYQTANDSAAGDVVGLNEPIFLSGTVTSSSGTNFVFTSATDKDQDALAKNWIKITSGTGEDSVRQIVSATKSGSGPYTYTCTLATSLTSAESATVNLYNRNYVAQFYDEANDELVLGYVSNAADIQNVLGRTDLLNVRSKGLYASKSTIGNLYAVSLTAGNIGLDTATILNTFVVLGTTTLANLMVSGGNQIGGSLTVSGASVLNGGATAGALFVTGGSLLQGALTVSGASVLNAGATAGALFVTGGSLLQGDLTVSGASVLNAGATAGALFVTGGSLLQGDLTVSGASVFNLGLTGGSLNITGESLLQGAVTAGALFVTGGSLLQGDLTVSGASVLNAGVTAGALFVTGGSLLQGDLTVSGASVLNAGVTAGALFVTGGSLLQGDLTVSGASVFNLGLTGGSLNITGPSWLQGGATAGALFVTGGSLLQGNVTVTGASVLLGNVTMGSNVAIVGPALQIPIGDIASRPSPADDGYIRYNTETQQFEGYGPGDAWGSLGGVIDIAQTTKILASETPSTTDGNLYFITVGSERMRINSAGNIGIGTSAPNYKLDVVGTLRASIGITTGSICVTGATLLQSDVTATGGSYTFGSTDITPILDATSATGGAIILNTVDISPSMGDISRERYFQAQNNVTTASVITGFAFNNAIVRAFDAVVSVTIIDGGSNKYAYYNLKGVQKASNWVLNSSYVGDSTGFTFSIDNSGQIKYTSTNIPNYVYSHVNFRALTTTVNPPPSP
jgi:hypothetical protein